MVDKNPNHTHEMIIGESQTAKVASLDLKTQDPKEDFLALKNQLIYFQNKGNLESIPQNLEEESKFLMINTDIDQEEAQANGLDLCILADVSESMYPFRVFLKKSIYFTLMDVENFFYRIEGITPEDFSKVRIAFVKYTDRGSDKVVETTDFIEYKNIGDICTKIDEIEIKAFSMRKRAVFDGLKSLTELNWNSDSVKMVLHFCADPQYGDVYTFNPKKMPENYDPFPEGVDDIDSEELLDKLSELNANFTFVKFHDRVDKYAAELKKKVQMTVNKILVDELN